MPTLVVVLMATSLFGYQAKLALCIDGTWVALDEFIDRTRDPDGWPTIDMSAVSDVINDHQASNVPRQAVAEGDWSCPVCQGPPDPWCAANDAPPMCADITCASHDADDEPEPERPKASELMGRLIG